MELNKAYSHEVASLENVTRDNDKEFRQFFEQIRDDDPDPYKWLNDNSGATTELPVNEIIKACRRVYTLEGYINS